MDYNKSASAPNWEDEKPSMVQNPPPPYSDNPGAPQPGPAYPQQGYGFPQQHGAVYNQQPQVAGQQYPGQPIPIAMQPTMYVTQSPSGKPVNDYLGYSIFTMLCCCLPLGIAALIYSISAREANFAGNQMSAERNSRTARTLNHAALGLGLGSLVLSVTYLLIIIMR